MEIFLVLFSVFVRIKAVINKKLKITDHAFEIRLADCSKLAINQENNNEVIICRHDVIANFFNVFVLFLSKFSYWSKFHVNIITGSEVMTIFVYKGLSRNPEIRNTPVWVSSNIWTLGQVRDTKFGKNVSMKSYWMLQNVRYAAFTVSELLKENQRRVGEGGKNNPTQIRVNDGTCNYTI